MTSPFQKLFVPLQKLEMSSSEKIDDDDDDADDDDVNEISSSWADPNNGTDTGWYSECRTRPPTLPIPIVVCDGDNGQERPACGLATSNDNIRCIMSFF
mmetsp:Transcript_27306/g.58426  ORF Transcript_27306/g.58426 Transcript_27306/m.58426 type:complete len:99 (+) Transcript_27306:937-1233(+)